MGEGGDRLKVLHILECLASFPNGLGVSEVSQRVGIPKSSVHRLLMAMEKEAYVVKEVAGKRYRLGAKVLQLADAYSRIADIRELARPHLRNLLDLTQETIHLVQLEETEGVYIDKLDTPQPIGLMSRVGKRILLHSTAAGKAILAYLPESRVRAIINRMGLEPQTANTITSYARLLEALNEVRERGCAIDDNENRLGVVCIGAPILDYQGWATGAISISAPASRMTTAQAERYAPDLLAAALKVSSSLGYQPDDRISGWVLKELASGAQR